MQNNENDVLLTYNCNVKNSAAADKIKRFVGNVCTNIIVNYKTVFFGGVNRICFKSILF